MYTYHTLKSSLALALALLIWGSFATVAQDKVGTTAAPFLGIGVGARAVGMGNAYVALAEDPVALYWNPAGVVQMRTSGVEFSNSTWFVDSRFQHVAAVLNTGNIGHLGISIMALNYGEIEVTTIDNPEGTGEQFSPLDLAVGLSYARALTDRFSAGLTVKYIQQSVWNESATGMALDMGVFYRSDVKNLRIGMSMSNFGTDLRLEGKDLRVAYDVAPNQEGNNPRLPANLEVDKWPLPLVFRVGVAADVINSNAQRLTLEADALHPNDNSESANLGAEYAFRELFFIRGGLRHAFASITDDSGWAAGAGIRVGLGNAVGFRLDYVYQQFQSGRLGRPQMLTMGVTF